MKLFSFDLDGTLLPLKEKIISEKMLKKLQSLLDEGNIVIINSGRPFDILRKFLKGIQSPLLFFAVCNGAGLYDQFGNLLFEKSVPHKDFIECHKNNPHYSIYTYTASNKLLCFKNDKYTRYEAGVNEQELKVIHDIEDLKNEKCFKVLYSSEDEIFDKIPPSFDKDRFTLIKTKATMAELMVKGIDKMSAIEFIIDRFNINKNDVYAFGDADNDYLSIKNYHGGTFLNGTDKCKKVAEYVSKLSDVAGLFDCFEYFRI